MANVLVTGATGLLGSALVPLLEGRGHEVTRLGHSHAADINADLVSYEQTTRVLGQIRPGIIINLMAQTDVDRCETHPQEAYLLNVKPVENLCSWIRTAGAHCHLIQISSDQLYDGPGPHSEDKVTIRNYYAMSKLAGELAAARVSSTILRTNFVGRSVREGRASLSDWLYDALRRGESINVFDDVLFSPLSISTLCDCIERCMVKRHVGVFNLGSHDGMSKADFAFAFADAIGLSTTNLVRNSSSVLSSLAARRPTDMRMQCDKFERHMKINLPQLLDEIQALADDYL
jgi:dTDP-4-dehydrorhamnose reductase